MTRESRYSITYFLLYNNQVPSLSHCYGITRSLEHDPMRIIGIRDARLEERKQSFLVGRLIHLVEQNCFGIIIHGDIHIGIEVTQVGQTRDRRRT